MDNSVWGKNNREKENKHRRGKEKNHSSSNQETSVVGPKSVVSVASNTNSDVNTARFESSSTNKIWGY